MAKFIGTQEIKIITAQQEFDSDYMYTMCALFLPYTNAYQIHLKKQKYSAAEDTYRSAGYWHVCTYRGKEKVIKTPNSVVKFASDCGIDRLEFRIANSQGLID